MSGRIVPALVGAALLAAALGLGFLGWRWTEGLAPFGPGDDQWSAVVVENDVAYFGHFASPPGRYAVLRDPYTLIGTPVAGSAATDLRVQRVTATIAGPVPEMRIDKRRILYVEELRSDSLVLRAILASKAR